MKVVIFETEQLSATHLQQLLLQVNPNIQVLAIISSVQQALRFFQQVQDVDLICMDIHLNDGSGLAMAKSWNIKVPILFTTAHHQYVFEALKIHCIDYLLKPIGKEALKKSIQKFESFYYKQPTDTTTKTPTNKSTPPSHGLRFIGQRGKSKYPIDSSEIAYFYIEDRIVWLVKKDGKSYMVNKIMEELEHLLDEQQFFRVNRKVIIALDTLEKMNTLKKSKLKLSLSPATPFEVIVPSAKSSRFKRWLKASA